MKRFSFLIVLLILFLAKGVAAEETKETFEVRVDNYLYHEYIKTQIPEKFVEPFFEATKKNKAIGIEILGLGFHESEWKNFISRTPNKNGSIDLGPLMLNSYNIADPEFMRRYGKNSAGYEYDTDVYYMTVCITFFKALRNEYGTYNALQVYNGGPRVMKSNCSKDLKRTVKTYANVVYKRINECSETWNDYKTENEEKVIAMLKQIDAQKEFLAKYKIKNGNLLDKMLTFSGYLHYALPRKELVYLKEEKSYSRIQAFRNRRIV